MFLIQADEYLNENYIPDSALSRDLETGNEINSIIQHIKEILNEWRRCVSATKQCTKRM